MLSRLRKIQLFSGKEGVKPVDSRGTAEINQPDFVERESRPRCHAEAVLAVT